MSSPGPGRGFGRGSGRGTPLGSPVPSTPSPTPSYGRGRSAPSSPTPSTSSSPGLPFQRSRPSTPSRGPHRALQRATTPLGGLHASTPLPAFGETRVITEPIPFVKKYGNIGKPTNVVTNFISVSFKGDQSPLLYSITFTPNIVDIGRRRLLLKCDSAQAVIGVTYAFTGNNIYLVKRLRDEPTVIKVKHENQEYRIVLKFIKKPEPSELIPFFNTLLQRASRALGMVEMNHKFFIPQLKIEMERYQVEIWPGYVSKIKELDQGLLLMIDTSHRIVCKTTAHNLILANYQKAKSLAINPRDYTTNAMIGQTVMTSYNNKTYRVDDLDFTVNPEHQFQKDDGTFMRYTEYFKKQWNLDIADLKQPLIVHQQSITPGQANRKKIYLVPELCVMTGLTAEITSDTTAMRNLAREKRADPNSRMKKINMYLNKLHSHPGARKIFADWNISFGQSPSVMSARLLDKEVLGFGGNVSVQTNNIVNWSNELRYRCHTIVNIKETIVVCCQRDKSLAGKVINGLKTWAGRMGFSFGETRPLALTSDNVFDFVQGIRNIYTSTRTCELFIILTPGAIQREDRYNAIKQVCSIEFGVPSQVIRAATVSDDRKFSGVCQKVALQIQCKVGGIPWTIAVPLKSVMFVGFDVYHDPSRKNESCVAVVASANSECTAWFSKVFFQKAGVEIASFIGVSVVAAGKQFIKNTGEMPRNVVVYRDGVGDGQMDIVRNVELEQVKRALVTLAKESECAFRAKLIFMIVQKRVDTKIMFEEQGSFTNPESGIILDRFITRKQYTDFYLVSQNCTIGTVVPSHYVVLHDDADTPINHLQKLTYKLTYNYYNWPGCVRVPSICQYAHKLAYLAGHNLKNTANVKLDDKLHYL